MPIRTSPPLHSVPGSSLDPVPMGTNAVIIRGVLRRDPEFRVLPSGDELMSCDLTVRGAEGPAESVPVVWLHPTRSSAKLAEGSDVVVVGRVQRRFFRAAGSTASRTEVRADRIVSASGPSRVRTAVSAAIGDISVEPV